MDDVAGGNGLLRAVVTGNYEVARFGESRRDAVELAVRELDAYATTKRGRTRGGRRCLVCGPCRRLGP